MGIIFYLRSW